MHPPLGAQRCSFWGIDPVKLCQTQESIFFSWVPHARHKCFIGLNCYWFFCFIGRHLMTWILSPNQWHCEIMSPGWIKDSDTELASGYYNHRWPKLLQKSIKGFTDPWELLNKPLRTKAVIWGSGCSKPQGLSIAYLKNEASAHNWKSSFQSSQSSHYISTNACLVPTFMLFPLPGIPIFSAA